MWNGSWTGDEPEARFSPDVFVADLMQQGNLLEGRINLRSAAGDVRGSVTGREVSVEFESDSGISYSMTGAARDDRRCSGTIHVSSREGTGSWRASRIVAREVSPTRSFDLPAPVHSVGVGLPVWLLAIAVDDEFLWLAAGDDLYQYSKEGELLRTIVIEDPALGTGQLPVYNIKGLASSGDNLWVTDQNDQVVQLDLDGVVLQRIDAPEQDPAGVTVDGPDLWVATPAPVGLDEGSMQLHRIDESGSVVETLAIDLPNPGWLTSDGVRFLTFGTHWIPGMYAVDRTGVVVEYLGATELVLEPYRQSDMLIACDFHDGLLWCLAERRDDFVIDPEEAHSPVPQMVSVFSLPD